MEFQPWEDHEHNQPKVQQREMRLPPHLQMFGNKLLLRDTFLALKLLSDNMVNQNEDSMVRRLMRGEQREVLSRKVKLLSTHMSPETIQACRSAANELFGIEVNKRRVDAARRYKPASRTVSDEAWKFHYTKMRKDREAAWEKKHGNNAPNAD